MGKLKTYQEQLQDIVEKASTQLKSSRRSWLPSRSSTLKSWKPKPASTA